MTCPAEETVDRYPAPALGKGIESIRLLQSEGALRLEDLADRTGIPKASLLRIMKTLVMQGIVERDSRSKKFVLKYAMVPIGDEINRFQAAISATLRRLAEQTGLTAEWYVSSTDGMIIADRYEPSDRPVRVVAKCGFLRRLHGELEAVARVAAANGLGFSTQEPEPAWVHDATGTRRFLTESECRSRIQEAVELPAVLDEHWNPSGVRRYAVAVQQANAELCGVLALAESFTPNADADITRHLEAIIAAARELTAAARTIP